MPRPDKRSVLASLAVKRLGSLCDAFELARAGLTRKDDLVDLLARSKHPSFEEILGHLKRDELKEVCRAHALDDAGKEKEPIIARILGREVEAQPGLPGVHAGPRSGAAPAPAEPAPKPKKARGKQENAEPVADAVPPATAAAKKSNGSLSTTIKTIQDIMRKDVGVDGDAQRIGQLVWLLFLKIWDDREQELELMETGFVSPLVDVKWTDMAGKTRTAEDLRWRAWATNDEGITGETLLAFVNDTLFAALKGMQLSPPSDNPAIEMLRRRRTLVKSVFEDAYQYMKSGTLLRQVVNKVQEAIDFNDSKSRHLFGDIYEQVLRDLQGAGNAGEYYTPRALTQFAVDMVDPRLGEVVLDPACGTGGFLACTIEHVRKREVKTPDDEAVLQKCILGVEKKPLPHLLCTTNMIVHELDVPTGIQHGNTLERPLRDISPRDRVDVIVTNPPFGGMEEDGIEDNFPLEFRTRETADLFLVTIVALLKDGGRAAVVLPDGTLFGEGVKTRVKERLLTECELHTIVRLPKGVFAPYTSIQTNILFFTKGRPTREVWYYEHPYPPGAKSYSKTKPMRIEEFAVEKAWWTDRKESEQAWKVSIADIKARAFNLDIKNPNTATPDHEDPGPLLDQYMNVKAAAAEVREKLREALADALAGRWTERELRVAFETLADAPEGVKRLRELVVQLAVQGKLSSQKNDSHETPINWSFRKLSEISIDFQNGLATRAAEGPPVVVLRLADIKKGKISEGSFRHINIPTEAARKYEVKENDILAIRVNGSADLVGRFVRVEQDAGWAYCDHLIRIRLQPEIILSQFLVLFGESRQAREHLVSVTVTTAGQRTVNQKGLGNLMVPTPPLEEQHRIVSEVDALMALCDDLEALLAKARGLQGLFAVAAVYLAD